MEELRNDLACGRDTMQSCSNHYKTKYFFQVPISKQELELEIPIPGKCPKLGERPLSLFLIRALVVHKIFEHGNKEGLPFWQQNILRQDIYLQLVKSYLHVLKDFSSELYMCLLKYHLQELFDPEANSGVCLLK